MSTYVVGDIQGCYNALRRVLDKVHFNPKHDVLWCVGDLVNRGPKSLETLRFLKGLGDACVCVLGNHDLHLLEKAAGGRDYPRDTLKQVLDAPDAHELVEWLRFRPLLHHDAKKGWCMVHAGLHPHWTLKEAKQRASDVESILRSHDWQAFCQKLQKTRFSATQSTNKHDQLMFTIAVLTRTRYCTQQGVFNWDVRSGEASCKREKPWFQHPILAWKKDCHVVFGHWAAMGLVNKEKHVIGLDTGCVWGGKMSLLKLNQHTLLSHHAEIHQVHA
ncbi:MAG: symmetrical bis(5'-nucleosyl)-tetraphosphatase [Mariprofundaceae bacterium]|nr:symmetrical bis(5'-nucleosyl)-tetraphosphatase [Mariprofundaceae bacterium]